MKKFLKILGSFLLALIILVVSGIGYLTLTEYKPADIENLSVKKINEDKFELGQNYKLLNWNIGFAGMDKDVDFFMDGGSMVLPIDKDHVENNLEEIKNLALKENADVTFFQEVDENSKRSYGINQIVYFDNYFRTNSLFAYNYKVAYVPYPWPTLGKMNSGIYTSSKYQITNASRHQLPVPFTYPTRIANLKRAFTAAYAPIKDSAKNLVLVNVHLEAYDGDNEGKIAQTKRVFEFLEEEYQKGNYIILGGDFNQALNNISEEELNNIPANLWRPKKFYSETLSNNFKIYYDDTIPTARLLNKPYKKGSVDTYTYVIDGFIISDNIKVSSVKTIDANFQHSDHNPLVLNFELLK